MIFLILSIISTTLIMVIFKITGRNSKGNFTLILFNYITAALLGYLLGGLPGKEVLHASWLPMAVIIGILFITLFFVIAGSTQRSGIAPTSVASKMSVAIPITFSIIYFNESVTLLKISGILIALVSVFLSIYRKEKSKGSGATVHLLPAILFFGAGLIDSLIKFSQGTVINEKDPLLFSSVLFTVSSLCGIIYLLFRISKWNGIFIPSSILPGILLGIVNFGSLYGIINALEKAPFDSSVVFGINNVGIVLLSVLTASIVFREQLSTINKIGIILSMIAIFILSVV